MRLRSTAAPLLSFGANAPTRSAAAFLIRDAAYPRGPPKSPFPGGPITSASSASGTADRQSAQHHPSPGSAAWIRGLDRSRRTARRVSYLAVTCASLFVCRSRPRAAPERVAELEGLNAVASLERKRPVLACLGVTLVGFLIHSNLGLELRRRCGLGSRQTLPRASEPARHTDGQRRATVRGSQRSAIQRYILPQDRARQGQRVRF